LGLFGRERYPESRCHADAPRRLPHWMTFGRYRPNEEKVTFAQFPVDKAPNFQI